ncbi:MAG: cation transporter, partial [Kiritimatiellia bacterium]
WMSSGMLKTTSRILMEGSPPDMSLDELRKSLKEINGVADLHHLHVWELDEHHRALEAHLVIDSEIDNTPVSRRDLRQLVKKTLAEMFDISHSTLEIETVEFSCDDEEKEHGSWAFR